MPIVKCSFPGCDRTLTRGLDTWEPANVPMCHDHWRMVEDGRAEAWEAQRVEIASRKQPARLPHMEPSGDA